MRIAIDEAGASVRGKPFLRDGNLARFLIPGRRGSADAKIVGVEIELAPQQSSTHRALAAWLGLAADE